MSELECDALVIFGVTGDRNNPRHTDHLFDLIDGYRDGAREDQPILG